MFSPIIQKLIDLFSKFPTVGPRTASRFVFYLLGQSKEETRGLLTAISDLKEKTKTPLGPKNVLKPRSKAEIFAAKT